MLQIYWQMTNAQEQQQLMQWVEAQLPAQTATCHVSCDVYVYELTTVFDWVKINRLRKHCIVVPIIPLELAHSSAIALDLQLQALLIKPITQQKLLRIAKKLYAQKHIQPSATPFQKAFLRRLIKNEVLHVEEMQQAYHFISAKHIPNVVLVLQGFGRTDHRKGVAADAQQLILTRLRQAFAPIAQITFLHAERYLVVLLQVPTSITSFKHWQQGVTILESVITTLRDEHNCYIFIGVGKIYRDALYLHHSYRQAKLARRRPALHNLHLRYYEDLTAHKQMQQAISYIEQHHTEPLTIQQVASHLNFSTSHFSRIFKREVGRSFVDYVAITRINKSLPYLRKHQYKLDIISTKVGFNTPNYFSMSFKKYVGFSPKVYRNTQEFLFI
ncbi:HTH-type transcriptional activator Btr [Metalysinibacillus saudimassiliensis]|uniref:HTH-type transcriptional activator Btr n=1 Tax=Metalysinibacillus saudimassiliensis TaxID=1461583 RepID=A0A078MD31_9BACL|nr:HTH-type transcriptional activator Btr [Metalysinibacillus saudimassiliensis]